MSFLALAIRNTMMWEKERERERVREERDCNSDDVSNQSHSQIEALIKNKRTTTSQRTSTTSYRNHYVIINYNQRIKNKVKSIQNKYNAL